MDRSKPRKTGVWSERFSKYRAVFSVLWILSGGPRRPAMEVARAELVCHWFHIIQPPPPVSSSPRPHRRRPPAPPGPRRRHPLATAPAISLVRRSPTGPTGGSAGNGHTQRSTKRGKLVLSASSPRNCSRVASLPQPFCESLWHSFVENSCTSSSQSCAKRTLH
jgi:hypothetical protein